MFRIAALLSAGLLLTGVLASCYPLRVVGAVMRGNQDEPQETGVGAPPSRPRTYEDAQLRVEVPGGWSVEVLPDKDPQAHAVCLRALDGVYARATVLRQPQDPGALPFEVVQNLRRANPALTAEPYFTLLGTHEARGYKYRFTVEQAGREGWIVSYVEADQEVGFLGQFPADVPAARREELQAVMRSFRTKPAPSKPQPEK